MMNWSSTTVFIGCRGIGKTYLSAVFCVVRAVLWPGSKICIAAAVRSQGINVLEKILLELKPDSPELAAEIDEKQTQINGTRAQIIFKNGSYIKVVTANDNARGEEILGIAPADSDIHSESGKKTGRLSHKFDKLIRVEGCTQKLRSHATHRR